MELCHDYSLNEIRFILEARRLNKAVAESAMHGDYGHSVGRTMHCLRQRQLMGDSIFTHILAYTSARAMHAWAVPQ